MADATLVTRTNDSYLSQWISRVSLCHWPSNEEEVGWLAKCCNLIGSMAGKHLVCLQCYPNRLNRSDIGSLAEVTSSDPFDLLLNQICQEELNNIQRIYRVFML